MIAKETGIAGCMVIELNKSVDHRGAFIKTFHRDIFMDLGVFSEWREQYYSVSRKNVLRGMHFQIPPHDHDKLVTCISGEILDVVLDLRKESVSYRKVVSVPMSSDTPTLLYIPKGLAHGFLSLSENSIMLYNTSTVYAPAHDAGIKWSSIGFDWPCSDPIISERDRRHPDLDDFRSPF